MSLAEKILDDTVEREEPLGLTSRFESAHLSFPLGEKILDISEAPAETMVTQTE